ncbi:MAG TPA: hypothetical protein VE825_08460 [Terriglobales bacterium]|jgi:hypothetical protein|nr:hypothetical protein [Terriglobales bacterium]
MNRLAKWVDAILTAGAWQGTAAAGDEYERWLEKLPPSRPAAGPPALGCPPRFSPSPAERPPRKERKSA